MPAMSAIANINQYPYYTKCILQNTEIFNGEKGDEKQSHEGGRITNILSNY